MDAKNIKEHHGNIYTATVNAPPTGLEGIPIPVGRSPSARMALMKCGGVIIFTSR